MLDLWGLRQLPHQGMLPASITNNEKLHYFISIFCWRGEGTAGVVVVVVFDVRNWIWGV